MMSEYVRMYCGLRLVAWGFMTESCRPGNNLCAPDKLRMPRQGLKAKQIQIHHSAPQEQLSMVLIVTCKRIPG